MINFMEMVFNLDREIFEIHESYEDQTELTDYVVNDYVSEDGIVGN